MNAGFFLLVNLDGIRPKNLEIILTSSIQGVYREYTSSIIIIKDTCFDQSGYSICYMYVICT